MPSRKPPVLVVDDNLDMREAIRDALSVEGYETEEATDGQTALHYLSAHPPPALILLDWNMAPMNGPQFMAEFTKLPALSAIPVVLITADAKITTKASSNGFAGYLKKPIDLDALFAIVSRYCR